jgi:type II secretory pathway component GspD/PulD (secretin)
VRVDEQGGNLIYSASVDDHERVQEYLTQLRHGRPLVVMQLYIWEVVLNKENATGINWSSFSLGKFSALGEKVLMSGSTAFSSITSPGVSLGATLTGLVDAETVLKFLATKGLVQTISNPQLTFVSGSSAVFRVGGEKRYISQVGELTSSVSGSNSSLGSNTVSTDSIETGLTVTINGSFESGVISAYLSVELQDIISLNETETQGMTIDLPETSERTVETSLRVRPGDNLVLAGLVTSRDENGREGVPTFLGTIPSYSSDTLKNTELVLLVKPSVVMFADTPEESENAQRAREQKEKKKDYLLDAVVIDKNGAQKLKIPDYQLKEEESKRKEDMAPFAEERKQVPLYQSSLPEEPPVDKNLIQRGFSYAFDDLLEPFDESKGR